MYLENANVLNRAILTATYNETLNTFKSNYDLVKTFNHFLQTIEQNVAVMSIGNQSNVALGENWKLVLDVDKSLLRKTGK